MVPSSGLTLGTTRTLRHVTAPQCSIDDVEDGYRGGFFDRFVAAGAGKVL
jgi:hypothetical protein